MAISLGGETLVVGARGEDGDATSRSDAFNDLAPEAGAVYVY